MLVYKDLSGEVPDTNAHYLELDKFSRDSPFCLVYGYNAQRNSEIFRRTAGKLRILFNNWAPCEFAQEFAFPGIKPLDAASNFHLIASICPYTTAWMNGLNKKARHVFVYYPIDLGLEPDDSKKEFDVIYHGGIHGIEHSLCLKAMSRFNYRYCSMSKHINAYTRSHLRYATNQDLTFRDKISLVAKSKISICYNLVHVMDEQVERILAYGTEQPNEAFSMVGFWNVMPQFKTRMHEAALAKSLNLVRRDQWNVAERFYRPNVDFLYFETERDLPKLLEAILAAWDSDRIQSLIESAYQRVKQFSTERFISDLESLCKRLVVVPA
jgi:hypothetical protein